MEDTLMSVWNIRALINASNWNQTTKNLSVICGIGVSYRYTISNKISETKGSNFNEKMAIDGII